MEKERNKMCAMVLGVLHGWQCRMLSCVDNGDTIGLVVGRLGIRVSVVAGNGHCFRRSLFLACASMEECRKFLVKLHSFLELYVSGVDFDFPAYFSGACE